jgi:PAS domain S-box-containing protein
MKRSTDNANTPAIDPNTLLRTVIDENPNIILMKDWDGKFLIGNRALANLYGTTPDELVGKDDGAFNPNTEQVAFFLQNVREVMSQSETQVVMEESTNAATGEVSYYQSIKKPLITREGKRQILVIANDVTELKRMQTRLEESERRLRYVLDATGEGVWDWNIATGVVTHNSRWCEITGLDSQHMEHPLDLFSALLHEDDKGAVMQRLQKCMRGEGVYRSEHRMRLNNGQVVWVLDRGDVVERDAAGAPVRMVGSFTDISERKANELALGVRTELLNAIFQLSPDGFVSFDSEMRVNYASPAFASMTMIDAAALNGVTEEAFSELLSQQCLPTGRFRGVQRLREDAAAGRSVERELIELSVPGHRVVEVGLRLSSSGAVSQILYFRDVTHETEVDQMKSDFLSTAAHELRTPMASIYGFAEVLLTQELDEDNRKEFTGIIFRQSELMASILNELLDLARIEARRGKDFVFDAVSVPTLVDAVVRGFKLPEERSAPRVLLVGAPMEVFGDTKKLQQALLNVLSNAYKYSPQGGDVCLTMEVTVRTSRSMVAIRIADQGIGLTSAQSQRVGERFYRADASGKVPGTGLGMSIVKEIIGLHGGELELTSGLGSGTVVTLWLPIHP